jgi:hypothetical protein
MIAANIQMERPAALGESVASVRCISTWSFGNVSTVSNRIRKKKPHTVGWVRSKLKFSSLVLS